MKFKNRGRKIYKTKEKKYCVKRKSGRFMSIGLSVLLFGGIVFVGYSVAEPLLNYTKKKGDSSISSLGTSMNPNDSTSSGNEDSENGLDSLENISTAYKCSFLSRSSLEDTYSLRVALDDIKDETDSEYVVIPLKTSGGRIYYDSDNRGAGYSGAVYSYISLDDIVSEVEESGLKAIAYMSVLDDNIYPSSYPDAGYRIEASGSMWLDNSPDNGGKPWLNPFTEEAEDYLTDIADEITLAGFDRIIFADIAFPSFRESDLDYIGEIVKDEKRYRTLVSLANELYMTSASNHTPSMIEVSAVDIANDTAEVLKSSLSTGTVVIKVDFDEFYEIENYSFNGDTTDNVKKLIRIIKDKLGDFNVIIRLIGDYSEDVLDAKDALVKLGYESYILEW